MKKGIMFDAQTNWYNNQAFLHQHQVQESYGFVVGR